MKKGFCINWDGIWSGGHEIFKQQVVRVENIGQADKPSGSSKVRLDFFPAPARQTIDKFLPSVTFIPVNFWESPSGVVALLRKPCVQRDEPLRQRKIFRFIKDFSVLLES